LKYQKFTPIGCTDICNRDFEFVAKNDSFLFKNPKFLFKKKILKTFFQPDIERQKDISEYSLIMKCNISTKNATRNNFSNFYFHSLNFDTMIWIILDLRGGEFSPVYPTKIQNFSHRIENIYIERK